MGRRFYIALAIYLVAHVYVWWRLVAPLPAPANLIVAVAVAVLAPTFPLTRTLARRRPRAAARPWLLLGYLWFGLSTYLLLGAIVAHLAVAFGAPARAAAAWCAGGATVIVLAGIVNVALGPRVRRVRIPIAKLRVPAYTIAHLTDVHIGPLIGKELAETMVRRVNALAPDLIVITGDLIDGRVRELAEHVAPLANLRARDGVYFVPGNHEYYWHAEEWLAHLGTLGIRVLSNEHVTLGDALELAGADDTSMHEDVPRATAGCNPALPLVLLAHRPRTVLRAQHHGVDVQLSGHTHGGQLLPWGWLARLWDPQVGGLGRFGPTWLYVSDGTGFWGPPLRVGTRCEIAAIELVPSEP